MLLYTGQYTGTGTAGSSAPTSVTFPFEPIVIFTPVSATDGYVGRVLSLEISATYAIITHFHPSSQLYVKKSADNKTISWYSSNNNSYQQRNTSGAIYYYAAIGGYDMGGEYERIITESGRFVVPNSGKYYIELYGGGGGMVAGGYRVSGSSSCQVYDSVTLQKGDVLTVSIGVGGDGTVQPTGTSFGNYHVDGGKNGDFSTIVSGSGNKGTSGQTGLMQYDIKNPSTGTYGDRFGYGINAYSGSVKGTGGPGAVYFKYLGE